MVRYPLLTFIIFLEIFDIIYCENGTSSSFSPRELKNGEGNGIYFDHNGASSKAKIVEKRRLLFNEGDVNSPANTERQFEINDPSRRTNITETQTQVTEYRMGRNNWENMQNKFSFPVESGNSQNPPEFPVRQPFVGLPNQNFNWGQRGDIIDVKQPQWNEEKTFNYVSNPESYSRVDNNYSGRVSQILNRNDMNDNTYQGRNADILNRKVSMTALNEKNYNDERVRGMNPDYVGTSNMNYYNSNSKGFWDTNLHRPEKGVIINFNTECPAPRHFSNHHMVHKFIFTPRPTTSIQPQISRFQIPETSPISGQQMTPMYYL